MINWKMLLLSCFVGMILSTGCGYAGLLWTESIWPATIWAMLVFMFITANLYSELTK